MKLAMGMNQPPIAQPGPNVVPGRPRRSWFLASRHCQTTVSTKMAMVRPPVTEAAKPTKPSALSRLPRSLRPSS